MWNSRCDSDLEIRELSESLRVIEGYREWNKNPCRKGCAAVA